MRRKIWMHNPHAGGTTIPSEVREETDRRIRAYAERRYAGAFSRLDIRFHGPLCYIDAYVEPEPPSRRLLHVLHETRAQFLNRVREVPLHLCRREKPTSALAVLGRHPRIDPERIAVMGFSKGGFAALYSSLRRFARMHGPAGLTFAAHVAFYPIRDRRPAGPRVTTSAPRSSGSVQRLTARGAPV